MRWLVLVLLALLLRVTWIWRPWIDRQQRRFCRFRCPVRAWTLLAWTTLDSRLDPASWVCGWTAYLTCATFFFFFFNRPSTEVQSTEVSSILNYNGYSSSLPPLTCWDSTIWPVILVLDNESIASSTSINLPHHRSESIAVPPPFNIWPVVKSLVANPSTIWQMLYSKQILHGKLSSDSGVLVLF